MVWEATVTDQIVAWTLALSGHRCGPWSKVQEEDALGDNFGKLSFNVLRIRN
jgi:hypothetical protein